MISVVSFSYKTTPNFLGASFCMPIDCRVMPNPHHIPTLRALTGRDPLVKEWVMENGGYRLLGFALSSINAGLTTIAFGCIGGKHRSVALAEALTAHLLPLGYEVKLEHLAL